MRVSRLHFDGELCVGARLELGTDASRYLYKVLRLKAGQRVALFNGEHGEFEGVLGPGVDGPACVSLDRQLRKPEPPALVIDLGLGLCRPDHMDFAIRKATELGVASITPTHCQRSVPGIRPAARLENKLRHWRRIAVSAAEQSGRLAIPVINRPLPFEAWLTTLDAGVRVLLDPAGTDSLDALQVSGTINLATGPEGGFAATEVELARCQGFAVVALGPRVLRAETAPLAALAILQHRYGDM